MDKLLSPQMDNCYSNTEYGSLSNKSAKVVWAVYPCHGGNPDALQLITAGLLGNADLR